MIAANALRNLLANSFSTAVFKLEPFRHGRGVKVFFRWGRKCSAKTVSGAADAKKSPAVCACARIWLQVGVSVVHMPPSLRRGAIYCTTTCVGCMAAQGCQTVHNCLLQRCLALQKQPLAPGNFHWRCF